MAAACPRLSRRGWRARIPVYMRWGAVILCSLLCLQLLSACATPTRAPVVSRDQPPRQLDKRPKFHRVKHGDTLYSIAWRYALDFRVLAHWNKITRPYTIYPRQVLRLSQPPRPAPRVSRARASKPPPAPAKKTIAPAKKTIAPAKRSPAKRNATIARKQPAKTASRQRSKLDWRWPTRGKVAQRFSATNAVRKGIKISGRFGQPVLAGESGKVVYAGSGLIGYGRLVIIKHNKNYLSAYAHNRKLLVKEGQEVARGESIAEMGSNGNWPMLHFEIRHNGTPVDPLKFLPRQR